MTAVLLIGNLRSSLPLARRLAKDGRAVHCGVEQADPYLHTSRAITGWFPHASVDLGPTPLLEQVDAYLAAHPEIGTLVPVSDNAARLFSAHRARFAGRVVLAVANKTAVEACTDKERMFALCEQLGVPIARRRIVVDHKGLTQAIAEIGLPCVVKPLDATEFIFGRKALVLRPGASVIEAIPAWPEKHEALCVQRYVAGYRHDVLFAASRGRLIGAVNARISRNDTADGTGYAVEMIAEPPTEIIRVGLQALSEHLAYDGVGALQFMIDPVSGEATFLELNPRLSACYRIAELCGLPLSRLIVQIAEGDAPAPPSDPWAHAVQRRVVWTKGHLAGLKREWARGELSMTEAARWGAAILCSLGVRDHLTFDPRDPLPTLWLYLHPLFDWALGRRKVSDRRSTPIIREHDAVTAA